MMRVVSYNITDYSMEHKCVSLGKKIMQTHKPDNQNKQPKTQ